MKSTVLNRVRKNGSAKAPVKQACKREPALPRASGSVQLVIRREDTGAVWARMDLPAGVYERMMEACRKLGVSLSQFIETACREVLPALEAGHVAAAESPAPTHQRKEAMPALGLSAPEQTLVALLAEWLELSPTDYCRGSVRNCFQANLDWVGEAVEGAKDPKDRADARRLLPRLQALFRGGQLEMSAFKGSPAVAGGAR